jgi:hypothetical protein
MQEDKKHIIRKAMECGAGMVGGVRVDSPTMPVVNEDLEPKLKDLGYRVGHPLRIITWEDYTQKR